MLDEHEAALATVVTVQVDDGVAGGAGAGEVVEHPSGIPDLRAALYQFERLECVEDGVASCQRHQRQQCAFAILRMADLAIGPQSLRDAALHDIGKKPLLPWNVVPVGTPPDTVVGVHLGKAIGGHAPESTGRRTWDDPTTWRSDRVQPFTVKVASRQVSGGPNSPKVVVYIAVRRILLFRPLQETGPPEGRRLRMHGQVVVVFREVLRRILGREVFLPDDVGDEVVGPEHIVSQGQQSTMFMLIDAGELHAAVRKPLPARLQTALHHRQPRRVPREIVFVQEAVAARVVRRIDVDALHGLPIGRLQRAQGRVVVAMHQHAADGSVEVGHAGQHGPLKRCVELRRVERQMRVAREQCVAVVGRCIANPLLPLRHLRRMRARPRHQRFAFAARGTQPRTLHQVAGLHDELALLEQARLQVFEGVQHGDEGERKFAADRELAALAAERLSGQVPELQKLVLQKIVEFTTKELTQAGVDEKVGAAPFDIAACMALQRLGLDLARQARIGKRRAAGSRWIDPAGEPGVEDAFLHVLAFGSVACVGLKLGRLSSFAAGSSGRLDGAKAERLRFDEGAMRKADLPFDRCARRAVNVCDLFDALRQVVALCALRVVALHVGRHDGQSHARTVGLGVGVARKALATLDIVAAFGGPVKESVAAIVGDAVRAVSPTASAGHEVAFVVVAGEEGVQRVVDARLLVFGREARQASQLGRDFGGQTVVKKAIYFDPAMVQNPVQAEVEFA